MGQEDYSNIHWADGAYGLRRLPGVEVLGDHAHAEADSMYGVRGSGWRAVVRVGGDGRLYCPNKGMGIETVGSNPALDPTQSGELLF